MDRAGFVGSDGAVHHGFCDLSFLRPMPNAVLMAPSDEADLRQMLDLAVELETFVALRYPRDEVPAANYLPSDLKLGESRTLRTGIDATIVAYGTCVADALAAADALLADGIDVEVVDARFCKPMDRQMVARVLDDGRPTVTVEDHIVEGGFGSAFLETAAGLGLSTAAVVRLGHPADKMIPFNSRAAQLAEAGIDASGIARTIRGKLESPLDSDVTSRRSEPVAV
jgi:1-deoxy-D-xylulose-5-phosphate synthase